MRCVLATFLLCAYSALSLAQEQSLPTTALPQEASVSLSEQLNAMAKTLEQVLSDSVTDWETLSEFLTSLSQKLERSVTSSRDLERESESTLKSLKDLEISLKASSKMLSQSKLSTNIWRTVACTTCGAAIGALVDDDDSTKGVCVGGAIGSLVGGIVWLFTAKVSL